MIASDPTQLLIGAVFLLLVAVAAISDVRTLRIPNGVSLLLLLLYPLHVATSAAAVTWAAALGIAGAVFAVGLGTYACNRLGGGDVKLLTAAALWAGSPLIFDFLMATALIGAGLALLMATRLRFVIASTSEAVGATLIRDRVLGAHVPYGVAIAVAAVLTIAPGLLSVAP